MKKQKFNRFFTVGCMLVALFSASTAFGFSPPPITGGAVLTVARQTSGDVLIGGSFTKVDGESQVGVARLTSTGELNTFISLGLTSEDPYASILVSKILVLSDDKMLVAGTFDSVTSQETTVSRNSLFRLNSDSSIDTSFPNIFDEAVTIYDMAYDAVNSKILVAGDFTKTVDGIDFERVLRLNDDGSVDAAFNPSPNEVVFSICVASSGKIYLGGAFSTVNSGDDTRNNLARFNSGGSFDAGFNPNPNGSVNKIIDTADGILVAGSFDTIAGEERNLIARLETSGALDNSFVSEIGNDYFVNQLAVLSSGQILAGGSFSYEVLEQLRYGLVKLAADGSIDTNFDASSFFLYEYDLPCGLYVFSDESEMVFGGLIQGADVPMGSISLDSTTSQTISFPSIADKVYDDEDFSLGATASSELPIHYKIISGEGFARLEEGLVKITGVGTVTIAATQFGDDTYSPAPKVTQSFTITKADQSISFDDLEDQSLQKWLVTTNAQASSGLKVTLTIVSGDANMYTFVKEGATAFGEDLGDLNVPTSLIELTGTGIVTVSATQEGNANYNAATEVIRSFTVL